MKSRRGRGTAATDKPPILGIISRGGHLVVRMCKNVQQQKIKPLITCVIKGGSCVNTDEYGIYNHVTEWGYQHSAVNHGRNEFARDGDGDGINEVHVNTIEGVWSLLRSWLRPHRGISQRHLPLYIAFFQAMHNIRLRAQSLLSSMLSLLLTPAS